MFNLLYDDMYADTYVAYTFNTDGEKSMLKMWIFCLQQCRESYCFIVPS